MPAVREDRIRAFYREFGRRLHDHRKAKGLSQEQLAEPLGLNRTSIYNLEKGKQQLPVHLLKELARRLGVSEDDLLPWKKLEEPPAEFEARLKAVEDSVAEEYQGAVKGLLESLEDKAKGQ